MPFPHDDDMTPKKRKQLIKIANPRIMEIRFMVKQERNRQAELERGLGDELTAMLKRPTRLLDDDRSSISTTRRCSSRAATRS